MEGEIVEPNEADENLCCEKKAFVILYFRRNFLLLDVLLSNTEQEGICVYKLKQDFDNDENMNTVSL